MNTAIIIHGMPFEEEYFKEDGSINYASVNHFIPWLKENLIKNNILAESPEMPIPYIPDYKAWKEEFESFDINENTILIGHSAGAGFILRYISENNIKVNKVALIAPWLNVNHEVNIDFLDFDLDKNILKKVKDLRIFYSIDDMDEIKFSIEEILIKIPELKNKIEYFEDKGHFTLEDMGNREFPELLEFLLK